MLALHLVIPNVRIESGSDVILAGHAFIFENGFPTSQKVAEAFADPSLVGIVGVG